MSLNINDNIKFYKLTLEEDRRQSGCKFIYEKHFNTIEECENHVKEFTESYPNIEEYSKQSFTAVNDTFYIYIGIINLFKIKPVYKNIG